MIISLQLFSRLFKSWFVVGTLDFYIIAPITCVIENGEFLSDSLFLQQTQFFFVFIIQRIVELSDTDRHVPDLLFYAYSHLNSNVYFTYDSRLSSDKWSTCNQIWLLY